MNNENGLMLVLAGVVVFLLIRELMCWYWKQSEQVNLLKDIRASLQRLEAQGGAPAPGAGPAAQLPGYTAYRLPPAPRGWRDRLFDRLSGVPGD